MWSNAAEGRKRLAQTRESTMHLVSQQLIEFAHVKPGNRVLDIATGLGEPAFRIAQLVGPSGYVVATDPAPRMIELARERMAELGVRNIEFIQTDAETLEVGATRFDAAVSRMGMMFVPDLNRAARRLAQVLMPGGYFAAAVWSTPDKVPMFGVGEEALRQAAGLPPREPGALHPARLGEPQPLLDALAGAGFKEIEVVRVPVQMTWKSAETFVEERKLSSAPFRTMLASIPSERHEELLRIVTEAARVYADAQGVVRMECETICIGSHR